MLFVLSLVGVVLGAWLWLSLRRSHRGSRLVQAAGLAVVAFVITAVAQTFTIIPAGHVGILDVFGSVSPTTLKPGPILVNPLARVVKIPIQMQELSVALDVPSREGLTLALEANLQFRLDPDNVFEIYKTVGDDYVAVLVNPQFRSVAAAATAAYDATALYTSQRAQVQKLMTQRLRDILEPRGILVEDVRFQKLTLPEKLAAAIEERQDAELESQRMQFVLEKERQEAERRRIEAQGLADAQRIVAQGLTEELLKFKGIEATLKLAESPNAKVIMVGSCKDGMPVILGGAE
jgi:regulator of protease activity HflC (stomatin/prohibitin superfamily)